MFNRRTGYGIITILLIGSIMMTVKFDVNVQPIAIITARGTGKLTTQNKTVQISTSFYNASLGIKIPKVVKKIKSTKLTIIKHFEPIQGENSFALGDIKGNSVVSDAQFGRPRKSRDFVRNLKKYKVQWYNPPKFLKLRNRAFRSTFAGCEFSNCQLTYDAKRAKDSDVIIFDGRWVPQRVKFRRPMGQVWIFAAHESPETYDDRGNWWTKPQWVSSFNWTMMYDKECADIYLPYGVIRPTTVNNHRNFTQVALSKKRTALAIISHCETHSLREIYIKKLTQYIDIDVLGACGEPWECGKRYLHDGCFQILNTTYKFFLAFENALCQNYFTEKLFENFNYDVILVVLGGQRGDIRQHLVKDTYISTDQFRTVHDLGGYLQRLTWSLNDYADILEKKSNYKSNGFEVVYKNALCDICKRINNLNLYGKTIKNIKNLIYGKSKCRRPVI